MDWITKELATGLQKLLCLCLEGQPSTETILGTVAAWREIITHKKQYDADRDAPRFREAFVLLGSRARRWPTPAEFLEALPKANTSGPKLAYVASEETRRSSMENCDAILRGKFS